MTDEELIAIFGPGPWALRDIVDNCWLGDLDGPIIFGELLDARIAATILNERFGYVARILPLTYEGGEVVFRDEVRPPLSAEEAMKRLCM